MGRVSSYREIGGPTGHLANLRQFTGNTMRGTWNCDSVYVVFSYSTEIARVSPEMEAPEVPERKYSSTTSKQQNLCRTWLPVGLARVKCGKLTPVR